MNETFFFQNTSAIENSLICKLNHGSELTSDYLEKHGFKKPILLEKKDGLGIIVPCRDEINLSQIENIVGM